MSRRPGPSARKRTRTTIAVAALVVAGGLTAYLVQPGPQPAPPAVEGPGHGAVRPSRPRPSSVAPAAGASPGPSAASPSASIELPVSHERSRLFMISGTPEGELAPGGSAPVDLVLTNPHAFTVSVTSLHVGVRRIRAPRADAGHPCTARDFELAQFSGPGFELPAASTTRLGRLGLAAARWPRVSMRDRPLNQDGCKGASLTLGYRGAGRR